MNAETQALLLNAVPLLLLAALYLAVGGLLARALWRERMRLRPIHLAAAAVVPAIGVSAAIVGIDILATREPIGGHAVVALVGILLASVPVVLAAGSWRELPVLIGSAVRAGANRETEPARRYPQLASGRLSRRLLEIDDESEIVRLLLDELMQLVGLDVANFVLVEDEQRRARIVGARDGGEDNQGLLGQEIALDREQSGVATVLREGVAFGVYDVENSEIVNRRLNEIARVKSCAFVPVLIGPVVAAVVFVGVRRPRIFRQDELTLMQALATEAGLALERIRSSTGLAEALERERLIARVSLAVRSRRNLDELLAVAVRETAQATGAQRCFIRLGEPDESVSVLAEWQEEGVEPLQGAGRLPGANLALRESRTVVVTDVVEAPELGDATLGDVGELTARGIRAILATPVDAHGRTIGVLGLHRSEPGRWSAADIALAEAVAHEAAIAIDTGRLLRESERRLAEQQALLKAGQALTSDLRVDAVIERLVHEICSLVDADAADCWTLVPGTPELVCRAVLGLPETEVGRHTPVAGTMGEAIGTGRPVLRRDFAATEQPPPTGSYAAFAEVMDAPIVSAGETIGVLGVCSREAGRFEESDLRLIEAFASLASIALRNAAAFEESKRQARIERGFHRMAAVLSEPLSTAATLDAVAQAAAEALGGDSAAVLRAMGSQLELAGSHGLATELADYLRDEAAVLTSCARSGKVLASRRLHGDGRFGDRLAEVAEKADRRSLLAIPLPEAGGEGLGLVLVFFAREESFEDDQLDLAGQVAGVARGALERSALYERERRSRSLAQRIAQAGRELAGELDPDNVLDQAVRHAVQLLAADGASVRLLEGDEVAVRAAVGSGDAAALGTRMPSTAWLVGDIVQTRSTRATTDVREDPRERDADVMLAAGYAAYLGVPMIGPDESVQGILAVYGLRPRRWREEEAEALHALGATVGTARANAELYQGVSHEQQRSEAILANVADGIVAVDREGKVVLWNPAAERVTGVPQRDALGRTPAEALGRSLEAEDGTLGGNRLVPIRRGDDEVWLSLSEAVMTDPAGLVAGRIFAFRDISAERSVEQMKSDFVSTVSHELRTPLTSIYGFAATLLREDVLFREEERATFLSYIASESDRLMAIVDRLLTVAQLDTGDLAVQLAETDVAAVVGEAVRSVESLNGDGHRFVVALGDEPLAAEADREKLGQVLAHLLDNAVRYSPAGGTVRVAARRREEAVEVSVQDEGIGIPAAEHERIFRKLYRGDAAAGAVGAGATGLGLFLAKGLVDAMGGRIRVESNEGRGATFTLELRAVGE